MNRLNMVILFKQASLKLSWARGIVLCVTFVLAGCYSEETTEDIFDNYLYRLSNSLEVDRFKNLPEKSLNWYPNKSILLYDIPDADINIMQFFQLSTCDLQRLIGERNSSLGKLMTGYHSLLYEEQFLALAKRCQAILEDSSPLQEILQTAIKHKETYQGQIRWNAIFATEEMSFLFSLGTQPLNGESLSNAPTELISALEYLNSWLSKPSMDKTALALQYETLAKRKYIGELRLTMATAIKTLNHADKLIEQRLSKKPLCYQQTPNSQFAIVEQVFKKYYIGQVQPILSKLYQQTQKTLLLIDKLQAALPAKSEFTTFWDHVYTSENSEWKRFEHAITEHTQHWQQLLSQCGRLPT